MAVAKKRLTSRQVETVRRLIREGYSVREVRRFTLHASSTIYKVVRTPQKVYRKVVL